MAWSPVAWCSNNWLKYTLVIAWISINSVVFWQTYMYYKRSARFYYLHEMLGAGLCVSRATANVSNLNLGMLLLPMCRATMAAVRSLPFPVSRHLVRTLVDHSKGFHILCAYTLVLASLMHFFSHVFNAVSFSQNYNPSFIDVNAATFPKENPLLLVIRSFPGVTGVIMLILLILILTSSSAAVRHSTYEIFWYTHRLFIIFYIFVLIHGFRGILKAQTNLTRHNPGCFPSNDTAAFPEPEMAQPEVAEPEAEADPLSCSEQPTFDTIGSMSWAWVCFPLLVYVGDMAYRKATQWRASCHVVGLTSHPCSVIELQIHKDAFSARAGQFILLQCPSISMLESHPYTITKVPDVGDPVLSVHIRVSGDWSARLKSRLFEEHEDNDDTDSLLPTTAYNCRLSVEGPFSSPMEDCLKYKVCLWVAGGIGVTPFITHLHSLRSTSVRESIVRIYFIWLCKEYDTFIVFAQLLCDVYEKFWEDNRPDGLQVSLHVTGDEHSFGEMGLGDHFDLLARRVSSGRPCWNTLLRQITKSHPRTTVGTFTCGPKSLVSDVITRCSELRKQGTTFQCYSESF